MLYPFTSHKFTNANATGPNGPKLDTVRAVYSSVDWAQDTTNNYLNMTNNNGIQLWTVPSSGKYTIKAVGANGGNTLNGTKGGKGIDISTIALLNKGEIISILVGQAGLSVNESSKEAAGGGGGSFVVREKNVPIIVAGGGGGETANLALSNYTGDKSGGDAVKTTNGSGGGISGGDAGKLSNKAGVDGNGATGSPGLYGNGNGAGGGGFKTGGKEGTQDERGAGAGFITGFGVGGGNNGGFGGGGTGYGSFQFSAGGGGGYSGGAGATYGGLPAIFYKSGGGGSYSISEMTVNGKNSSTDGNGSVTITLNK
jgi:hypothetical protein